MADSIQRCIVIYAGPVQGVGFRMTTHQAARHFDVIGWVRNEPDRTVRVVAEGTRMEVDGFLDEIRDRMSGYIQTETIDWSTPAGEFTSFEIAY